MENQSLQDDNIASLSPELDLSVLSKILDTSTLNERQLGKHFDTVNGTLQYLSASACSSPMRDLGCDELLDASENSHEKGSATLSRDETEDGKRNKNHKSSDDGHPSQGHALSKTGLVDDRGNASADELPPLRPDHDKEREWLLTTRQELFKLKTELAEHSKQTLEEIKEELSGLLPQYGISIFLRDKNFNRLEQSVKSASQMPPQNVAIDQQALLDRQNDLKECLLQMSAQRNWSLERMIHMLIRHRWFTLQLSEMHKMLDYLENAETSSTE